MKLSKVVYSSPYGSEPLQRWTSTLMLDSNKGSANECEVLYLGPLFTNGYLLWDDLDNAVFVDPARAEVLKFFGQRLRLLWVFLTHGHQII